MAGPPETIPPNALFQALCAMPRAFRDVDLPRNNPLTGAPVGKVRMQVLTQEEKEICAAAAEEHTRKSLKQIPKADEAKKGYDDVYRNAASVEVLYRACRRVEDPKWPFFPSPNEMRKQMSGDEIGVLMANYLTVQDEIGPIVSRLSTEEMDAWIRVLVEGASTLPFDRLSSEGLRTLAFSLAERLYPSLTDTTYAGTPPESGEPESSRPNADAATSL